MNIPENCLRCGVCCHSSLDAYVRVSGDDWARFGADAERVAHFLGHRAFMRMADGHCAALEVRPAVRVTGASSGSGAARAGAEEPSATEYFCTVYAQRPQICRDLGRGSPECEGELATKAERVAGA